MSEQAVSNRLDDAANYELKKEDVARANAQIGVNYAVDCREHRTLASHDTMRASQRIKAVSGLEQ